MTYKFPDITDADTRAFVQDRSILITLAGSKSYGTDHAGSDTDYRGVLILPQDEYFSFRSPREQVIWQEPERDEEGTIYELRKFVGLALQCNPNIIECLFCHDDHIAHITDDGILLRENRKIFLSQRAHKSFLGYALSQLKRIKSHKSWLDNPPKSKPTREEFGLPDFRPVSMEQINAARTFVMKHTEAMVPWLVKADNLHKEAFYEGVIWLLAAMLEHEGKGFEQTFETWVDMEDYGQQIVAETLGFDAGFIELLKREKAYLQATNHWRSYLSWKQGRNRARAELETKYGYDCYSEDTEFLTEGGWKQYSDIIDTDRLATVNISNRQIEYENFSNRIFKDYSGEMILLKTTNTLVTPEHNLLVSPGHRSRKNDFATYYLEDFADWRLASAQSLIDCSKSHFHIMQSASFSVDDYNMDDTYLLLAGAFISEGCVNKRNTKGEARSIRIEQKDDGDLVPIMNEVISSGKYVIKYYPIKKKNYSGHLWVVSGDVCAQLENDFGSSSYDKKLPKWSRELSTRQAMLLLSSMNAGDGTPHGSGNVYYTVSKKLADDIQTMCTHVGIVCSIWGPYSGIGYDKECEIYHVFISDDSQYRSIYLREQSQNVTKKEYSGKVVCFDVPNGTLVTRRKGKVSIHGNCKHAMHLVRLMKMGEEVLLTGNVDVYRENDREELIGIRNGSWPYEKLVEWADEKAEFLNQIVRSGQSVLPVEPDYDAADKLVIELIRHGG